jgi:hypothetical protein
MMKQVSSLKIMSGGVLALILIFSGCDGLLGNNDGSTDRTALGTAIAAANTAKENVETSEDGTDVLSTVYWVKAEQMSTFTTAISAAQLVYDSTEADQTTVDNAKTVLETAANTFNGYKQLGTKIGGEQDAAYDVYIAGSYSNGGNSLPCYWENGVKTDLPLGGEWIRGSADKVVVNAGDIYILGTADNGARSVGCYWKNGVISFLPYTGGYGYGNDITISDGNVYIAGHFEALNGESFIPCYWRNGMRTDLTINGNSHQGYATTIALSGNTIHIGGYYYLPDSENPGNGEWLGFYWKNGIKTDLPSANYYVYDIAVDGNDIYLTGGGESRAWYWKNGSLSVLSSENSSGHSITVSNNAVYIAGNYWNGSTSQACYWKNGTLNNLAGGTAGKDSFAYSIIITDGNVYVVGAVNLFHDFENGTSGATACYWKNGVKTNLLDNGSANGIAVVSKND